MLIDYSGARGSNAGDDFHELWVVRQAIRLLSNEDGLEAIAVEGVSRRDRSGKPKDTWNGVDCTLYFGGRCPAEAERIEIVQVKYSSAQPNKRWTVARLAAGQQSERSVVGKLAKAWKELQAPSEREAQITATLISNQPIAKNVLQTVKAFALGQGETLEDKSSTLGKQKARLAKATGLKGNEFRKFAASLRLEGGIGSRLAIEERVLQLIAEWTEHGVQQHVVNLQQYVRRKMMPECAGELITRESVLLWIGVSDPEALFPCPPHIHHIEDPVGRESVQKVAEAMCSGTKHICLHGAAGVGKTTVLQEIQQNLPPGSVIIKYDCYGGGRYLDPSALRHRTKDALLQIINELAVCIKLPLFVVPDSSTDYPRQFARRLKYAAQTITNRADGALIVIAIDAADNAVFAAQDRKPVESPFVHEFIRLKELPDNVRFIVTARTGRLNDLNLPDFYGKFEVPPFSQKETSEHVSRVWPAPQSWIDDFHHFSGGIPRVQATAFDSAQENPKAALQRLMPNGKSLEDIFRERFEDAAQKAGAQTDLRRLCAGLVALPRPVPLSALAVVLDQSEAQMLDVCRDLAPSIRCEDNSISFADEDLEHFVRDAAQDVLEGIEDRVAKWMLAHHKDNGYASVNVASSLLAANRRAELLTLVEENPTPRPEVLPNPILRAEVELQRLRLAITVCREAADVPRALRFVLVGAESIKTEEALCNLLVENADLSVRFAEESSKRLVLSDPHLMEHHGTFLFQKLSVDANRGDAISVREGKRRLWAWLDMRKEHQLEETHNDLWDISVSDISSMVEATLKLHGPAAALDDLQRWQPKRIALEVGLALPWKLIAEGDRVDVDSIATNYLDPLQSLFLLVPLALAGRSVDVYRMAEGLHQLIKCKLPIARFVKDHRQEQSLEGRILNIALTAGEILTARNVAHEVVDKLLDSLLESELTSVQNYSEYQSWKLDILLRAYVLRESRGGRTPTPTGMFSSSTDQDTSHPRADRHDEVRSIAATFFDIYSAVATCLVKELESAEMNKRLDKARGRLAEESWRFSRYGADKLRGCGAAQVGVLLFAGYAPEVVWRLAIQIHSDWRNGQGVPDEEFVARFSLWPQLHCKLIEELGTAAEKARTARIAARDKSDMLARYARYLIPLSEPEAKAVFNYAADAVGELDGEVMDQIRLFDQLVAHAVDSGDISTDRRQTTQNLGEVVVDAAIRLEGHRHFPWVEAMSALARLDFPVSLANAARWHDEDVVGLSQTLQPVLSTAISQGAVRPEQYTALCIFLDNDKGVVKQSLKKAGERCSSALAEETAYDVLIRGFGQAKEVLEYVEAKKIGGRWIEALRRQERFRATLPPKASPERGYAALSESSESPLDAHIWENETLVDAAELGKVVQNLADRKGKGQQSLSVTTILKSARSRVLPAQRIGHLNALAKLKPQRAVTGTIAEAILAAVDTWSPSPAMLDWCQSRLPEVIVSRFADFVGYFPYNEGSLGVALERTGLANDACCDLILRGLERNVGALSATATFGLVGLAGRKLAPSDTAKLVDWYAGELAKSICDEYRDQTMPVEEFPKSVDGAVARFLFAYLGDCDLRLRWRAAHAMRRLAKVGDVETLKALISDYSRSDEQAFRSPGDAFYWLAARLWFVVSWDRIAGESPHIAAHAANDLLGIALDDSFPHVLVRAFARDACEKLIEAEVMSPTTEERGQLKHVNRTPLPRSQKLGYARGSFGHGNKGHRFHFNTMDTLPYWYEPMLRVFANLKSEVFLKEVERWIIDVWGQTPNIVSWDSEPRRGRFEGIDSALSYHSHGSIPTLEQLSTHLEWHAMWCAVGELLKTEPLASFDEPGWDRIEDQIGAAMLMGPPLWSSDLLVPVPLQIQYWQIDQGNIEEWVLDIDEAFHRSQIFPTDCADYIVVSGSSVRCWGEHNEWVGIYSALVEPETGQSLLRALQTMEDYTDYKMPDEDEDWAEVDEAPYRFIGWLRSADSGSGIDEKDPFRAYGLTIGTRPGERVVEACALRRDTNGRPRWYGNGSEAPMFIYEAWGKDQEDQRKYPSHLSVAGTRLLVHREQLLSFLHGQGMDLIIEVGVTRHGRKNRRYSSEKEGAEPEGRFARLYRLDNRGGLEIAEGRVGAWAGDRSAA